MTLSKLFSGSADGNDTALTTVNSNLGPIDRFFRTHYHHKIPHQFFSHHTPSEYSSYTSPVHHAPNHDYSAGAHHPSPYGMYGPHQQGYGLKLGHGGYDDISYSYGTSGGPMYYDHPISHHHYSSSSSGRTKGGGKGALSALTLLAFLFFLHLLQSCLKEHMDTMNPTVMVMTAGSGREQMEKADFNIPDTADDDDKLKAIRRNATDREDSTLAQRFVEIPKLTKENSTKSQVYLKGYYSPYSAVGNDEGFFCGGVNDTLNGAGSYLVEVSDEQPKEEMRKNTIYRESRKLLNTKKRVERNHCFRIVQMLLGM
ncbi:hypothetical protein DMENIID0001_074720 [Sergentomyia squamirostris]